MSLFGYDDRRRKRRGLFHSTAYFFKRTAARTLPRRRLAIAGIALMTAAVVWLRTGDLEPENLADLNSVHASVIIGLHTASRSASASINQPSERHRLADPLAALQVTHKHLPNGLLAIDPGGSHPLYQLIAEAEGEWKQKLGRASKSLKEAVNEYMHRYKRMPPKNFDKWWDYVVEHNVQLPDEYDRIHYDLEPFWGISPTLLRKINEDWEAKKEPKGACFTLVSQNGTIALSNDSSISSGRSDAQLDFLEDVAKWLPDFRASFTAHDGPNHLASYDAISKARGAIGTKLLESLDEFPRQGSGWGQACHPDSPLRAHGFNLSIDEGSLWDSPKTFISDHRSVMNLCQHPNDVSLNGLLRGYNNGPAPRFPLIPSFTISTTSLHADILAIPYVAWSESVGLDPPWKEKKYDQLMWRGSNTGALFQPGDLAKWNQSQRARLVRNANKIEGVLPVLPSKGSRDEPVGDAQPRAWKGLNENLMDIAFAGKPTQCRPPYCEELPKLFRYAPGRQSQTEANQFKYIIDVDGNGWSSRFKRLMTTNSLILKATIFPEWFSDRVQPWVHYVPVKYDFTDLYDIMTFFRGDAHGMNSQDVLAERIATQGKEWSQNYWRWEDMVAYSFRLFLEYGRVMSLDRDAASFRWEDVSS